MLDETETTGGYPALPTAKSAAEQTAPLSTLQTLADRHARLLWGADIAGGPPIPMADVSGNLIAYAFPYIRRAQDAVRFPEREQLFRGIEKIRSEHKPSDSAGVAPDELSARFHRDVAQRLGQFGSVYVSATRARFPVFRASYFLHPYFLSGQQAQEEARRYFKGRPVKLERLYFLGPHQEYFEFSSQGHRLLINVDSLITQKPQQVLVDGPRSPTPPEVASSVADAWKGVSELTSEAPPGEELASETVKLIPRYELIPVVNQTYWCAPTARTMVLGFWDRMGFGRLIDYWLNHPDNQPPTYGHNIPNLMLKLIDPDTGTWAEGWKDTIKSEAGCNFAFQSVEGTSENDWAWNELKAEINSGRPVHWEIFDPGHAMAAFGYRITPIGKFVIVYNSSRPTRREEWHYAAYAGAPATKTYVNPILPEQIGSRDNLALVSPGGGESVCQWVADEIRWFVWGDAIKKVDFLFSTDGGNTWSLIASGVGTNPGDNAHIWHPTVATRRARIRLRGYGANGDYIAGDGSHSNFTVAGGPILQVAGRVRLLKLSASEADAGSPGAPSNVEAIVTLDSEPDRALHLGLRRGLLSPVRERTLAILQEALDQNHPVVIDNVQTDAQNGTIIRAWVRKEV